MQDKQPETVPVIAEAPVPFDSTGVPNLDLVLGGGLLRGTLLIVVGPPGCGKTTLASQMAFAAARTGRRVLIFTALSESAGKLLTHLRAYDFFDPDLIGDLVTVLSLEQFLHDGLADAGRRVVDV